MSESLVRRRFTAEEYHQMGRSGILREDDRVELIEGEIVLMSPIGRRHAACVKRLLHLLVQALGKRAVVGVQDPVRLDDSSEPQPDLSILKPRADFYASALPGAGDVLWLIEVTDTSRDYDRDIKLPLYARSGVPEVWLVDLTAERVEVHRAPAGGRYSDVQQLGPGDSLSPLAFAGLSIAADAVLGK
jgi:Uma2 family endonuclease